MAIGGQIIAPEGYGPIAPNQRCFMLRNDAVLERVLMVSFVGNVAGYRLIILSRDAFEAALASRKIQRLPMQDCWSLPPWLSDLQGRRFDREDAFMVDTNKEGKTKRQAVEARLEILQPALAAVADILSAEDPDKALNRISRQQEPRQNAKRFRVWFYAYLAFNHDQWVLLPSNAGRGLYDRTDTKYAESKFGKSPFGRRISKDSVAAIKDGFTRHVKVGKRMRQVYKDVITKDLGAKARNKNNVAEGFYHPEGKPFPTERQFRYRCEAIFTVQGVRRALTGDQKHRNEQAPYEGKYSSGTANVLQVVHADARASRKYPKSYVGKHHLPKLWIVEFYDGLSGFGCGIGFSLASESKWAYLAACFCMAIPKSKFGQIIGYPISDEEWPGHGLPASIAHDRGPGASERVIQAVKDSNMGRAIAPSYTPQSNTRAESMHPRAMKKVGAPEYEVSDLTPVEMIKQASQQLVLQNTTSSALDIATPEMIGRGIKTKLDLWNEMILRGRLDVYQITFEEAVRRFLPPVKLRITGGQLMFKGLPYSSADYKTTRLFARSRNLRGDDAEVDGYVFELCCRVLWIEVDGRLVEVEAQKGFLDDDVEFNLSLPELELFAEAKGKAAYALRQQSLVAQTIGEEKFEEQTGKKWDAGQSRKGRAKVKTADAMNEVRQLKA